jgi:hypothetical protein
LGKKNILILPSGFFLGGNFFVRQMFGERTPLHFFLSANKQHHGGCVICWQNRWQVFVRKLVRKNAKEGIF